MLIVKINFLPYFQLYGVHIDAYFTDYVVMILQKLSKAEKRVKIRDNRDSDSEEEPMMTAVSTQHNKQIVA